MPKKTSAPKQSKAAFVRNLPNTPAKEVVAKAKASGMVLSEAYVYNVRATTKSKKNASKTTVSLFKNGHNVAGRTAEDLLRAVAAELGLTRAIGILQAEHDRVHRLLGG